MCTFKEICLAVSGILQGCSKDTSRMLQRCFKDAYCFKDTSTMVQWDVKDASWLDTSGMLKEWFKDDSQGGLKDTSMICHKWFMHTSMMIQGSMHQGGFCKWMMCSQGYILSLFVDSILCIFTGRSKLYSKCTKVSQIWPPNGHSVANPPV